MYNTNPNTREFHRVKSAYENLEDLDQLSIWSYLIGAPVSLEHRICNPLRADKHANCWLSIGSVKSGYVVLNDYARRMFHGFTVFDAIMYRYGCTFRGACDKIEEWIHYNKVSVSPGAFSSLSQQKREFHYRLLYTPWTLGGKEVFTKTDQEYWGRYGISKEELVTDHVKSIRKVAYNTKQNPDAFFMFKPKGPAYAYNFGPRRKTYQPFGQPKFLSTCTSDDIWGINSLSGNEAIIITKSYKDHRVIRNAGYDCIGLQSETTPLGWDTLLRLEQYKNKFILFDNDDTGKEQGAALASYCNQIGTNYRAIWLDTSDNDSAELVERSSTSELRQALINIM